MLVFVNESYKVEWGVLYNSGSKNKNQGGRIDV